MIPGVDLRRTPYLALLVLALAPTATAQDDGYPTADFTYAPERPEVGERVQFTDASRPGASPIVNWTWDFGDGSYAYEPNVSHAYAQTGYFVVQLTVTATDGLSDALAWEVPVHADVAATALPNWLYWAMPLIVSAILYTLAYLVLSKGQPAVYNLVFFLFYVASATKSLTEGFALLLGASDSAIADGVRHLNAWSAFVLGPLFLWFVLVFPRPAHRWLNEGKRGAVVLLLAVPFLFADLFKVWDYVTLTNIFDVFVSVLALACLGLLVYHAWEIDSAEERQRIRYLGVTFFILVFSSLVLTSLDIVSNALARDNDPAAADYANAQAFFGFLIVPVLEIVGAVLLLFAILRYQLMGVDRLVKKITRNGVVGITMPSIFIIVGNVIEEIFQNTVLAKFSGFQLDFIIAGFVAAFAMVPLQKWVTFLTNKWFPTLESPEELSRRRMEIYEAQLRYHLLDGSLNDKEYRILRRLRDEIQLQPHELETVVRSFPGVALETLSAPGFAAAPTAAPA